MFENWPMTVSAGILFLFPQAWLYRWLLTISGSQIRRGGERIPEAWTCSLRGIRFHKTSDTETDLIPDPEIKDQSFECDSLHPKKREGDLVFYMDIPLGERDFYSFVCESMCNQGVNCILRLPCHGEVVGPDYKLEVQA